MKVSSKDESSKAVLLFFTLAVTKLFIMFGSVIPYIPQYLKMDHTNNVQGFSIYVSMAVMISSCLKISYWFSDPYDVPIFIQNISLVIMMIALLELRVRVLDRLSGPLGVSEDDQRGFLDWDLTYFWDWTNLLSYIQATVLITLFFSFVLIFAGWIPGVIPSVGYLAVLFEAAVTTPQFWTNYKTASTYGLSTYMVWMWAFADFFKIFYSAFRAVPTSFIVCYYFQFMVDIAILGQIYYYGNSTPAPNTSHRAP